MARSVRVFGAESRAEGVDGAKSRGSEFAFQLSAHGKCRRFSEEVAAVVGFAVLCHGQAAQREGGHLEHCAGSFAVAGCDERCVEVEESFFLEKFMDGESQCGTHAQHRSECVGAGAQVRFLAQEFERVPFFLQRVCFVGGAEHCQFFGLHFHALSFALGCHERAFYVDGRTRGDGFQLLVAEAVHVEHNLQVADGGSVVQCHELHVLVASARAHPTHHVDGGVERGRGEDIGYFSAFHRVS